MSLLATLAAALAVDGPDACISCGAPTSSHLDARKRWIGHVSADQPQPEPQPLVRLARVLDFPAKRLDVHGASVAQPNRDAARCVMHQDGR
jgi:hypothetical protein